MKNFTHQIVIHHSFFEKNVFLENNLTVYSYIYCTFYFLQKFILHKLFHTKKENRFLDSLLNVSEIIL